MSPGILFFTFYQYRMKMLITTINSTALAASLIMCSKFITGRINAVAATTAKCQVFVFKSYQNGTFESRQCSRSLSFL